MENTIPIVELDAMDINGLKKLRKEMSKRIHNLKVRDSLRINVYIAAEIRDKIDSAVKWAYARKYIKKPSYWSFCKFCINNTVLYVTGEIMKEEAEKARLATTVSPGFDIVAQNPPTTHLQPPNSSYDEFAK